MSRRSAAIKRVPPQDPVYDSQLVSRFVNRMMQRGKKSTAQNLFYSALTLIQEKTAQEPLDIFNKAVKNVTPLVEVKARRVGGANYQVPIEVRPERRTTLALRWLVNYARLRGEKTMYERLAYEIMDAANNTGAAVRRREEVHQMAEANKAFAHYRW